MAEGSEQLETVEEIRARVLNWLLGVAATVSVIPYAIGTWSALQQDKTGAAIGQVCVYLILVGLALARKLPHRIRATIFLVLLYVAMLFAWVDLGYSADAALLSVVMVIWTSLLLGFRAGALALLAVLLAIAGAAFGHLSGQLEGDAVIAQGSGHIQNWVTAAVAVAAIGSAIGLATAYVVRRLELGREQLLETAVRLRDEMHVRKNEEEERRSAELQLAESQRLEAVGQFAGGIAHDFNNLLTVIHGSVESLQDELPRLEASERIFRDLTDAIASSSRLTRQLLTLSRRRPRQIEVVNLSDLVKQTTEMISRLIPSNIEVTCKTPKADATTQCDPAQIQQVCLNLALNARDAMPEGGRLTVSLDQTPEGVVLTVTDTGTGVDGETKERMFEPLFTTKGPGEGTGLGLAVVARVVKEHGGRVEVESQLGQGTSVRVVLPRGDISTRSESERPETAPFGTERVLLADDQPAVLRMLERSFQAAGYDVMVANSGTRALEILRAEPDVGLLVSDIVMPGITGLELAKQARDVRPSLPVVLISGYVPDESTRDTVATSGFQIVEKPFSRLKILTVARAALEGK